MTELEILELFQTHVNLDVFQTLMNAIYVPILGGGRSRSIPNSDRSTERRILFKMKRFVPASLPLLLVGIAAGSCSSLVGLLKQRAELQTT